MQTYKEVLKNLESDFDKKYPGWRDDKVTGIKLKKSAKKIAQISRRIDELSKRFELPETEIRKMFQFHQNWNEVIKILKTGEDEDSTKK